MLEQGFDPASGIVTEDQEKEATRFASTLTWADIEPYTAAKKKTRKDEDDLHTDAISTATPFFAGLRPVIDSTDRVIRKLIDATEDRPVVVEGRTIGAYTYPEADFKFYVTADLQTRAERRAFTYSQKGKIVPVEEVAERLAERDRLDQSRDYQPTNPTGSHMVVNTSYQSVEQSLSSTMDILENPRLPGKTNEMARLLTARRKLVEESAPSSDVSGAHVAAVEARKTDGKARVRGNGPITDPRKPRRPERRPDGETP
jgi:cytidylate kinase